MRSFEKSDDEGIGNLVKAKTTVNQLTIWIRIAFIVAGVTNELGLHSIYGSVL